MMGLQQREHEAQEPLLEKQAMQQPARRSWLNRGLIITVFSLCCSNLILAYKATSATPIKVQKELSKFAGLAFNTPVIFQNWTEFTDPELLNQSWRDIDLSPLEVMFGDDELANFGLEPSLARFPWDPSRGIYFVKALHGLHCLKYLRYAIEKPSSERHHVNHCLDTLRQDIMCFADDTPMPLHDLPDKVGNGQVRMCRNFDALLQWTKRPDRFPCYDRLRNHSNAIEAHGWCGPESPYYDTQEAYFAKWGHS